MNLPAQEQQHPLVVGLRNMIYRALEASPLDRAPTKNAIAVREGREAAEKVRGIVVTNQEQAEAVTALGIKITAGLKAGKAETDGVLAIPKQAVTAVGEVWKPIELRLTQARDEAGRALTGYNRRRDEESRRQQREQQAELDRQARETEAAQPEEEPAPPLEAAPVASVPKPGLTKTVAGSHVVTTRLTCELVNHHEVDPVWLKLVNTIEPLAAFERAVRLEEVKRPATVGESVTWMGCRFFLKDSAGSFRAEG